ncbi:DNA polymerase III subunits gamma and tau (EC 2.7.7.7), partial [Candidatus Synechococcus spongiarum]
APAPARQPTAAPQRPQVSPTVSTTPASGSSVTLPAALPSAEDGAKAAELDKLWQAILDQFQLQFPRFSPILRQQGKVASWDGSQLVVQINQIWLEKTEARRPLLEQAVAAALGKTAHLVLTGAASVEADRDQRPASPPESQPKSLQKGVAQPPSQAQAQTPTRTQVKPPQAGSQGRPQPRLQPQPATSPWERHHNRREPSPGAPPEVSSTSLDATARTLANFFNGEVVDSGNDAP